ncbi:hypothetical protein KK083_21105 [Fulvivirgaceae bacterium PWU4]|uniref:Uncharacterized protein n=1 Tax=Chryseosolibacter histidini TaxID=2782349 RepID=A0AAP2DPX6_9BACT|nr:hypothetical protein [Chryseosolibacter histidini]MBT1699409.1 hypothetical protein [Chryseosolibacter histidini]
MARCLKGESTPEDDMMLQDLLSSDPGMKEEYDLFRSLVQNECNTQLNGDSSEAHLQKKFDRITRRLKEEGSL